MCYVTRMEFCHVHCTIFTPFMKKTFVQFGTQRINMALVQRYEATDEERFGIVNGISLYFSSSDVINLNFSTAEKRDVVLKALDILFCDSDLKLT